LHSLTCAFQSQTSQLGRDVSEEIRSSLMKFDQTRQRYAAMTEAEWYLICHVITMFLN
jgi:uncharacterized protein YacL (UPF0231 family)